MDNENFPGYHVWLRRVCHFRTEIVTFSDLNDILTKKRNRFTAEVIESILRLKMGLRNSNASCHDFVFDKKMVASCQAARRKYKIQKELKDQQKSEERLKQLQEKEEEERLRREVVENLATREKMIKEKEKAAEELLKSYQSAVCSLRAEREKLTQEQVDLVTSTSSKRRCIE